MESSVTLGDLRVMATSSGWSLRLVSWALVTSSSPGRGRTLQWAGDRGGPA